MGCRLFRRFVVLPVGSGQRGLCRSLVKGLAGRGVPRGRFSSTPHFLGFLLPRLAGLLCPSVAYVIFCVFFGFSFMAIIVAPEDTNIMLAKAGSDLRFLFDRKGVEEEAPQTNSMPKQGSRQSREPRRHC